MMVAEHPPARQRHMPPLQIIPKGFGISNPTKGKKRTGPYFTEIARNLLSTGQPESMQTCLGIKNGEIVRILSFYVRALRLARNNEKICTAASRDRLPQNARREKPFVPEFDGTVQHENVEVADKLKVLKAIIQKKDGFQHLPLVRDLNILMLDGSVKLRDKLKVLKAIIQKKDVDRLL